MFCPRAPYSSTYQPDGYLNENPYIVLIYVFQLVVSLIGVGHAANSHLGPTLPTADPSGQSLASAVQAI